MKSTQKTLPWFERPYMTVSETAIILCCSRTWVRNKLVSGALEPAGTCETQPTCVATHSVATLIDRIALKQKRRQLRPAPSARRREYLRLVVNNDA